MSSGRRHVLLCVHGSPSCYASLDQCPPRHPAPLLGLQGPAASGCLHACATSSTDQGAYGLVGGEELIDAERDQLLQLCRQRLDAFREQRGEEVGCLLTQKPAASGTGAATAPRSAARSKSGHGADGLALHQPEWNAVVELVHSIQR
jgi:hypothetical protein